MLDLNHLVSSSRADVQVFMGDGAGVPKSWIKPRGVSMLYMFCVGAGGNGGNGAVGAAGSSSGGGGGASSAQSTLLIPAIFVPDALDVTVPTLAGGASIVAIPGGGNANTRVLRSDGGGNGGNASGATAGTAGTAPSATNINAMLLAGLGRYTLIAGQNGSAGGPSAGAGAALSLPTNGLVVTGGTGGGGTGSGVGAPGGSRTGAGIFPTMPGGSGASLETTPPGHGNSGISPILGLLYNYGGTGGGSSHGAATGAGLVGGLGGNGAPGCGGGGGGGALTGSTQGIGGRGGPGFVIIIAW